MGTTTEKDEFEDERRVGGVGSADPDRPGFLTSTVTRRVFDPPESV